MKVIASADGRLMIMSGAPVEAFFLEQYKHGAEMIGFEGRKKGDAAWTNPVTITLKPAPEIPTEVLPTDFVDDGLAGKG